MTEEQQRAAIVHECVMTILSMELEALKRTEAPGERVAIRMAVDEIARRLPKEIGRGKAAVTE